MPLPDRQRSRAVLIGTGTYADDKLHNLPVVRRTISDLAAALTDPVHGVVAENHCTALEDQADIRLIGRALRSAANQAEDLLLVYFVGQRAGKRSLWFAARKPRESKSGSRLLRFWPAP